ncbi:MAG: RluA family pseudouridine synthase [Sphingomonas adhaesiva]|uniref:RluA family pseudouridine synthase n=1 Tax=Sphingomonas adhaesiva TaxID=28212 RepID=UPI002FF91AEA
MSDQVRQFTIAPDDDGIRVDRWFKRHLDATSFTTVAKWARTGQIRVDGARVAPGDRLQSGQVLRIPPAEPVRGDVRPERTRPALTADEEAFAREMVIHKDAQALVLNKPPGLATQGGTKTTQHVDGLLDALQYEAEGRPKLVHRLDKDTSGALLVARTSRAAAFFAKTFSGRSAKKVYWALIVGVPSIDDGTIDLPIAKQPGTGGEKMHVDEAEGSPARSRYRVIERAGNRAAWVELQPFTGRTHQLRVHMAAIGHPIVGDGKYGGPAAFLTGGISRKMHLHARRIRVDHPDGGEIEVTAELPTHFAESLAGLGFEPMAGDMMPLDEPTPPTREEKKARARAHAKSVRKERRGERRSRSGGDEKPGGAGRGTKAGGAGRGAKPAGPSRGVKPGGSGRGDGSGGRGRR